MKNFDNIYGGRALRIVVGITMLVLLLAGGAGASTLTVCPIGCTYSSIQGAINAASIGDTVEVQSGTYYENVNVNKQLTLRGIGMPVVEGDESKNSITLSANGITLEGFTAVLGRFGMFDSGTSGIKVTSNNNIISGNKASNNIIGYGIYMSSSNNNTLFDNDASNNRFGIVLNHSSDNTLISNNALDNRGSSLGSAYGIYLYYSNNNTLIGNNASKNSGYTGRGFSEITGYGYGIGIRLYSSNNNTLISNNASFNYGGFGAYYNTYGYGYGIALHSSSNNTLISNNASNNDGYNWGIYFYNTGHGIYMYNSSKNMLIGNTALNNHNGDGIYLFASCDNNTLSDNNASNNLNGDGIDLNDQSSNNMLIGNIVSNNSKSGIRLRLFSNNTIYNNIFNNTNNVEFLDSNINSWNTTKTLAINIIGGSYLGGNFWGNPNGTGFSQTCADADGDGICDSPYMIASDNIDYLPLAYKSAITPTPTPTPIPTTTPLLVSALTPNSRNAQVGMPVTIFKTVINGGAGNATGVSIKQATGLPISVSYQQWNGVSFTGLPNTPVDLPAGGIANFVLTLTPTAGFGTASVTFNVSGTNAAPAGISAVNTLTMSASTVAPSDVIMMSTNLNVQTAVNTPTAFAVATSNVGASATGVNFNVVIPSSISGLVVQVNQTNPTTGAIIGPATGLNINSGAQLTFAVFVTPTAAIASDPANNRIRLQLVNGSGKVIGAQSVAVSTT